MDKVVVDRGAILALLRETLGIEVPAVVNEPPVVDDGKPVNVEPKAGCQVAIDLPPVDNPDYEPASTTELSKAAYALAGRVPKERMGEFYAKLQQLANNSRSEPMETYEAKLRGEIQRMLSEADDDPIGGMKADWEEDLPGEAEISPEEIEATRQDIDAKAKASLKKPWSSIKLGKKKTPEKLGAATKSAPTAYEEPPKHEPGSKLQRGRKYSWEEIQADIGASTPTTAKQMSGDPKRAMDKMRWIHDMPREEKEKLRDQAVQEYVDDLKASGVLTDADVQELMANPGHVTGLDSFRTWTWSRKGTLRNAFNQAIESGAFKPKKSEDF